MAGRVQDKVAFITGAGGGMGKADALLLAREGAKIVVTDIQEEKVKEVQLKLWLTAVKLLPIVIT